MQFFLIAIGKSLSLLSADNLRIVGKIIMLSGCKGGTFNNISFDSCAFF